jgi:hypothetical protein
VTAAGQENELRHVALGVVLFLLPFEVNRALVEYPGQAGGFSRFVSVGLFDVALVAFVALALLSLGSRRSVVIGWGGWLAIGLLVVTVVSLPFHGSWRGVALGLRLVAAVMVALEIGGMRRREVMQFVILPLVVAAAAQGVLAFGQAVNGGPLGVPGEPTEFGAVADTVRPAGTASHPYMLTTYCLVAVSAGALVWTQSISRWWLGPLALAAVPIGLSFSRAAVVSVLFAGVGWVIAVVGKPRIYGPPVAAVMLGIAVPALLFAPAWLERLEDSTTGSLNDASANRVELTNQAIDMIADYTLVGVGPWRYTIVAEADYPLATGDDSPVHSLPFLVTTEFGVVIGIAFLAALVALGVRAGRTGPLTFALFGAVMGFTVFDVVLYWYPAGLVLFGVWLGLLDRAARPPEPQLPAATTDAGESAGS